MDITKVKKANFLKFYIKAREIGLRKKNILNARFYDKKPLVTY